MDTTMDHDDLWGPTWVPDCAGAKPPGPAFAPGIERVGTRYRLLERIGAGGCGEVYLASDEGILCRRVALKRLCPALRAVPLAVRRFAREARMAARVRHPGIVAVYDYDLAEDGDPYLVMEHVPGLTLETLARRGLRPAEAAAIGLGLLDALDALDRAGVVHRDVKPNNVIADERAPPTVKLVDFGLAKSVREPPADIDVCEAICGTPQYMAPEQIRGHPVDGRTDRFALACVLYELLSGRPWNDGPSRREVLTRQLQEAPRPLSERGVTVPRALERALAQTLAKDPADRPDSSASLRRGLEAVA